MLNENYRKALLEAKKRRNKIKTTYTTGDPALNIKHFNKMMGNDNNNPSTEEAKASKAAEAACAKAGTFASAAPDGGNCVGGGEGCCEGYILKEDVASSMPVHPLAAQDIKDYAKAHLTTNPTNPKCFPVGYIKEFSNEIAASYRGGRGSAGMPIIRIFKCIEYSAVYTGISWYSTDKTMAADSVIGSDRHTGEKTGFNYTSGEENIIGHYANGDEALQIYIHDTSVQKVKYLVSINDSDLAEIDKADLAKYLTTSAARDILAPVEYAAGYDASGDAVYDRKINRLKLANIYMIGNVGPHIM